MVWIPSACAPGQPAVLAENEVELDSLRSESLALIRFRLRSSAQPDGWGNEYGCGEAGSRKARPRRSPKSGPDPTTLLYAPRSGGPDGSGRAIV